MGLWEVIWTVLGMAGDVLVAGDFFVEIDSYAIASLATHVVRGVTRWGLFLMREVRLLFLWVHSLWESGELRRIRTYTPGLSLRKDTVRV